MTPKQNVTISKILPVKGLCGRCFSEYIDRSQSCWYFQPSFVNCWPSNLLSGSILLRQAPVAKSLYRSVFLDDDILHCFLWVLIFLQKKHCLIWHITSLNNCWIHRVFIQRQRVLYDWVAGLGRGGAKSQDGEKARSSLNHSIRYSLSRRFVHVNKE